MNEDSSWFLFYKKPQVLRIFALHRAGVFHQVNVRFRNSRYYVAHELRSFALNDSLEKCVVQYFACKYLRVDVWLIHWQTISESSSNDGLLIDCINHWKPKIPPP